MAADETADAAPRASKREICSSGEPFNCAIVSAWAASTSAELEREEASLALCIAAANLPTSPPKSRDRDRTSSLLKTSSSALFSNLRISRSSFSENRFRSSRASANSWPSL